MDSAVRTMSCSCPTFCTTRRSRRIRRLVRKVYEHLAPGGRLVIKDRFLDEAGTGPAWTTAFAVHILVNTQQGGCYKTAEAMQWMTKAGFRFGE